MFINIQKYNFSVDDIGIYVLKVRSKKVHGARCTGQGPGAKVHGPRFQS
jgi:hypothetical protein